MVAVVVVVVLKSEKTTISFVGHARDSRGLSLSLFLSLFAKALRFESDMYICNEERELETQRFIFVIQNGFI